MLGKADKVSAAHAPLMYKQDEILSSLGWEQEDRSEFLISDQKHFHSENKMDLGDKNIVQMIAKVIEEGKDVDLDIVVRSGFYFSVYKGSFITKISFSPFVMFCAQLQTQMVTGSC